MSYLIKKYSVIFPRQISWITSNNTFEIGLWKKIALTIQNYASPNNSSYRAYKMTCESFLFLTGNLWVPPPQPPFTQPMSVKHRQSLLSIKLSLGLKDMLGLRKILLCAAPGDINTTFFLADVNVQVDPFSFKVMIEITIRNEIFDMKFVTFFYWDWRG